LSKELETPHGSETVLVVDDQDDVRALARRILEKNGYRVLEASNGAEGLSICGQHEGPIHLMMTDVVMPELTGLQLAERAATTRPEMRILFTSGYRQSAGGQHVLSPTMPFLAKPFTAGLLARKVREVLDAPIAPLFSWPGGPTEGDR
jgi:CheY-like chemotaxis protein